MRCSQLETSRPPWETRNEATDSSVGKRNEVTPERGSCRLMRHQELKHDRNWCESVNSVKDGIWEDKRGRMIDRNYNLGRSKVLHWREVLLIDSTKRTLVGS